LSRGYKKSWESGWSRDPLSKSLDLHHYHTSAASRRPMGVPQPQDHPSVAAPLNLSRKKTGTIERALEQPDKQQTSVFNSGVLFIPFVFGSSYSRYSRYAIILALTLTNRAQLT